MQVLRDSTSISEWAASNSDPTLVELIVAHIQILTEYEGYDWSELVRFVVVERNDTVSSLEGALGFPVMANRFDGCRYGEPGFSPSWEFINEHKDWYEVVYVLGDDGFGVVVFVEKHADLELLHMLQFYSNK